jgi:hypothetical protein
MFCSIHVTTFNFSQILGAGYFELYLGRNSRERDKSGWFYRTCILVLLMFPSNWNVRSMSGHVSELVVSSFVANPCRLKDNQDVNHGSIYRASREL